MLKSILTIVPILVAIMWYLARRMVAERPVRQAALPDETEAVMFGTQLIDDGIAYYSDWAAAMLREYDSTVEPSLPRWYEISQELSTYPRAERRLKVTQAVRTPSA